MSWTDERVELLSKLWLDGRSASQIAGELGLGVTRNAVIGKVHRLGLAGRPKAAPPAPPAPVRTKPKPVLRHPEVDVPISLVVDDDGSGDVSLPAFVAVQPRAVAEVTIPVSERVTIMDLRESSCRWPMGDPTSPEFRYCGARAPIGSGPYCAAHSRLAFQPTPDRRRDRVDRYARIA